MLWAEAASNHARILLNEALAQEVFHAQVWESARNPFGILWQNWHLTMVRSLSSFVVMLWAEIITPPTFFFNLTRVMTPVEKFSPVSVCPKGFQIQCDTEVFSPLTLPDPQVWWCIDPLAVWPSMCCAGASPVTKEAACACKAAWGSQP